MVTVVYNGYTIPNKYGAFDYHEDEKQLNISLTFLVKASTSALLITAVQDAETKLTEINKDFSLSLSGGAEYNLTHSGNSGMLARPRLNKLNNELSTELSQAFSWSITLELPMTQYGARREGRYTVSYEPSRGKSVNFNVSYTASGSNSALTNYNDVTNGGKAWATSILTALGGTYELITENIPQEQEGKLLSASLLYKEILSDQSTSGRNDTAIVDSHVSFSVNYEQNVVSSTNYVMPTKAHVTIQYSCRFDKDVVTETTAETVYQTRVKPMIIGKVYSLLGMDSYHVGPAYVFEAEHKSFDPTSFSFSGSMTLLALRGIVQIIELDESISIYDDRGVMDEKLWDGNDDTYNLWGIGGRKTATRSITVTKCGMRAQSPKPYKPGKGLKAILKNRQTREVVRIMGIGSPAVTGSGGYTTSVTAYINTFVESYLLVKPTAYSNSGKVNLLASSPVDTDFEGVSKPRWMI